MRERATGQQPPDKRLHVWWARRPLTVSRAAVLGSLLPADFDRETFERLLGFGRPGHELVDVRALMDTGVRVNGGFNCGRAFTNRVDPSDLTKAHAAARDLWGGDIGLIDPMAGGGSIPLEAARMGFDAIANEYNPVACSILEATVDYPFRFGPELADKARKWGKVWEERVAERLEPFYPKEHYALVHAYIYTRTVPCPDTGHPTPLVPDWHLLKPKSGLRLVAEPVAASAVGRVCRCAGEPGSRWARERVSRGATVRQSRARVPSREQWTLDDTGPRGRQARRATARTADTDLHARSCGLAVHRHSHPRGLHQGHGPRNSWSSPSRLTPQPNRRRRDRQA